MIPTATALGQAFATIMLGILAMLAQQTARSAVLQQVGVPLHNRLVRLVQRLDRLVARWQAGTLTPSRPRPSQKRVTRPSAPHPPLPREYAWLINIYQPTAQHGAQIEARLADPEIRALVEAAPQAGRLLRPLCRALALHQPDWLRLPRRPRKPPAPKRAAPKRPTARPAGPPPFRPLPAYVLSAVSAWHKPGR